MNKFDTQVCTTREQSERLLALGLKKETADTFIWGCNGKDYIALNSPAAAISEKQGDIYAWSLHRLIEMLPQYIHLDDYADTHYCLTIDPLKIIYKNSHRLWIYQSDEGSLYDKLINTIEWTIKNNFFNKEYLNQ